MHILLIEDNPRVSVSVQKGLTEEGYTVESAATAKDAFNAIEQNTFDLLLLDLGLPDQDGIEILRSVRKTDAQLPVIILTARDTIDQKVRGLEDGANDYLVKPFAFPELVARIQVQLRQQKKADTTLSLGPLELDLIKNEARLSDQMVDLTKREFELLSYLVSYKNTKVSRDMIAREVWKAHQAVNVDNIIDVYISRLRDKIDKTLDVPLIHTIRGVGFMAKDTP